MEPALHVSEAVERLKGVFLEIPGTRLNVGDASRLAGLDDLLCQEILIALEHANFLKQGRDGRYQRRTTDSPDS
jgi:hypothetical protein